MAADPMTVAAGAPAPSQAGEALLPEAEPLSASALLAAIVSEGVTHVVAIPDNDTAPLLDRLAGRSEVALIRVAREGEAFGVAAGLWLGGASPMVVIQNTGLLEAGDALRGTVSRMGVPLVLLVGYRGFAKMRDAGLDPAVPGGAPALAREHLVRPDVDAVALMTEPTLAAWGVPCARVGAAGDLARVAEVFARARAEERPVALLLTRTLGQ